MSYRTFLESKIETAPVSGFDVRPEEINPALKPHQKDAVIWALHGGRRCLKHSAWERRSRSWNSAISACGVSGERP